MSLQPGRRLGPYEVISLLGAGGMGEVYRARDTRLDRIVAIKVLPSDLTADENLRARFEREARAISALSHPNICALHDIGRDGDTEYLVMEYLEGETLAQKIARGPLALKHVLEFGTQIAEALQHAHRSGISHRDLKPGNIMITRSGTKLLDFGLAKFMEPESLVFSGQSAEATPLAPLTAEGMVVGTYQYMSPEQIEGKTADQRSDIFSLGVILYEMATGQQPFKGSSPASLMASILSSEPPPLRSLQPAAPPELERTVLTALEKNPEERWQTALDMARQLRWSSEPPQTAGGLAEKRRFEWKTWLLVPLLLTAVGLTWGASRWLEEPRVNSTKAHLYLWLPPEIRPMSFPETSHFALSPDGRTLCLAARTVEGQALYLRDLDSYRLRKVEGSEGASGVFWSSDGDWIGFTARGTLWKKKVSSAGAPEPLCEVAANGAVASWRGKTILFADVAGGRPGIFRVSDSGGEAVAVTHLNPARREWRHAVPYLLPDGEHFLYQSYIADSIERRLIFASLKSPKESVVLPNVSQVRLVGDQLIYVRDAKLLTQRFDADSGMVIGDPVALASDISYFYPTALADFDVAAGTAVYRTNTSTGRLALVSRSGRETRLIDDKNVIWDFGLSPDGGKAAVSVVNRATGLSDIWIYDLARGVRERFTNEPWVEVSPVWSPDGRSVVYSEAAGGTFPHIVRRALSASTSTDVSSRGPFQFARSISGDGQTLFFERENPRTRSDIMRLDMRTGKIETILDSTSSESEPAVSPDGKWLSFSSDATGGPEVYLMNLDGGEPLRIRLSPKGGRAPRWRQDGQELFYLSADNGIVSVLPGTTGRWEDAKVNELFRFAGTSDYAVLPGGQSFVVAMGSPGPSDSLFYIIMGLQ